MPRVDLVARETQYMKTQAPQHRFGDRLVFKELHIAGAQRHTALLLVRSDDRLEVLAFSLSQLFRVVVVRSLVPVTLVEIGLQPRRFVESFAVNRFDFRRQYGPLGARVLAPFL